MMPMIKGGNIKKYFPIIQDCLQGDHEGLRHGAFWFLLECVSQVSNTLSFLHTTAFNDSCISYATLKDSGLEHLQESREPSQMVHCDLKPTNILFEDMQFKLIDFGTSRTTARLLKEDFAYEGGSARYFSPVRWVCLADEHLSAVLGIDKKTILGSIHPTSYDIWALGLVLAEAMGIDSFRLLSIEEHDRIETIYISSEYLAGRKKIVINKERDRWFAAWKNTTDLGGADDINTPVDIQELSEQMPSYAGLAALLQKMLSVESQVIDDPCAKHHPITAAEISIQCKSMIHQQGLVENQKEKFVRYLQAETKDNSPVLSKGWMI
jgi:serine/threonine protein kinase